jgi:hypothetical protein
LARVTPGSTSALFGQKLKANPQTVDATLYQLPFRGQTKGIDAEQAL